MSKELIEWFKALAVALVVGLVLSHFFTVLQVFDISMNPTLVQGDHLVLYNTNKLEKGDVVIFKTDALMDEKDLAKLNFLQRWRNGKHKTFIKRVIATAGDSLKIEDGKVYVNGTEIQEEYILEPYTTGSVNYDKLPEGTVFAVGDNRGYSHDSRMSDIGPVPVEWVKGKVIFRFWPFNKIDFFSKNISDWAYERAKNKQLKDKTA